MSTSKLNTTIKPMVTISTPDHDSVEPSQPSNAKTILRASLDVELTFPAFRLPGVFDRQFESNFMYANADSDQPRCFRRQFFNPLDASSSSSKISPLRQFSGPPSNEEANKIAKSIDDKMISEYLHAHRMHAESVRFVNNNQSINLIPMGSIGTRMLPVSPADSSSPYTAVRNLIFGNARKASISRMERKEATFSSVVDIDNEAFENYVSEDLAGRFGDSEFFSKYMLIFILLNSIMIGLETDHNIKTSFSTVFSALDSIFLSIFIIEILFKWYYSFFSFWKSPWNLSDLFLVIIALLGPLISFASSSRILKMIRILRAFRSLRSVSAFAGMYTVLQTILSSIPDMLNIIFLMVIVMFIFSVVGVSLFASTSPERFGDLGSSMFSLFVIAAQDNWVNIFDDLIEKHADYTTVALFMVIYITLGGFVFLNLIVAVVVNNLDQTYDNIRRQLRLKYRQLKSNPMNFAPQTDEDRDCVDLPEGHESVYQRQIPYEIPYFDCITEAKLQKYCLILMVIEENLKEYLTIKETLNGILTEIKQLNAKDREEEKDQEMNDEDNEFESPENLQEIAADPLSRLIASQAKS